MLVNNKNVHRRLIEMNGHIHNIDLMAQSIKGLISDVEVHKMISMLKKIHKNEELAHMISECKATLLEIEKHLTSTIGKK